MGSVFGVSKSPPTVSNDPAPTVIEQSEAQKQAIYKDLAKRRRATLLTSGAGLGPVLGKTQYNVRAAQEMRKRLGAM